MPKEIWFPGLYGNQIDKSSARRSVQEGKMSDIAAGQQNPSVTFRLYCFSNENALELLPPEGTMVIQYLQFPIDFDDCTCIPTGGVGYWRKTGVTHDLERQWYKPREPLERKDIPAEITGSYPLVIVSVL
jgi:hypothetical protein